MNENCQLVVFSDRAYNAIIRETFEWDPVETGGILLGHVLDNGCWIVMEVLPPGYGEGREGDQVYHEYGYFEYNQKFVNYLAKSVSEQYEMPLELLGLWHRHPGSMDHFSGTDDRTNSTFAAQSPHGVISGLINVDDQLRMTMYYLAHSDAIGYRRPRYQKVDIEVGSDLIPEEYFKFRYFHGSERDLHPYAPQKVDRQESNFHQSYITIEQKPQVSVENATEKRINEENEQNSHTSVERTSEESIDGEHNPQTFTEEVKKKKKAIIILVMVIPFLFSLFSVKENFSKISITNKLFKNFQFFEVKDISPQKNRRSAEQKKTCCSSDSGKSTKEKLKSKEDKQKDCKNKDVSNHEHKN